MFTLKLCLMRFESVIDCRSFTDATQTVNNLVFVFIRLLTIVIAYAAIEFKTPLGAQQVAIETPASQQQMRDLAVQCRLQCNEVKKEMKTLKSEVNKNSDENTEQSTKLLTILNDIIKINGILSPSDPDGILTKVRAIIADIADVKNEHKVLQRDLVEVKGKQERSDTYVSTSKTNIRKSVTENSDANSALSKKLSAVEEDLNVHKLKFDTTTSNVDAINEKMKKANDTVSEVEEIAKTATEMVDQANAKLKIMERHLFNKGALTAAILILFFLIIGLMLYVLKLKSSLESALAGGSSSRPLKEKSMEHCSGSREMTVVLHKMPSRPTLDNAVCIVCFDASNTDEYKRMIKETVGQLGRVSFRTHVIRKHADIAELPHCRLYIMCVEFTESHVIIEEQGLGLGDLKLTSYRGALVILYIHDPGSRNLTDDQLYSDGVYCVKKQQELKELCEIDRFISAHKNLNTAQKKALETAITDELKIQAAR
ncbi:hypothetical protein MAR_019966 [Mya arenaria]|uniref:Uncharacterized protein n=1 Tax=Mya arenaria TaxID=6604 RepID=A0ABY7E3M8_MYAAR|nr:hypothetical protein MAR_019966 [Mya arenaria]